MTDKDSTADDDAPEERLKLTKRRLEDLPPDEADTEGVKGGVPPPPYTPVGPGRSD